MDTRYELHVTSQQSVVNISCPVTVNASTASSCVGDMASLQSCVSLYARFNHQHWYPHMVGAQVSHQCLYHHMDLTGANSHHQCNPLVTLATPFVFALLLVTCVYVMSVKESISRRPDYLMICVSNMSCVGLHPVDQQLPNHILVMYITTAMQRAFLQPFHHSCLHQSLFLLRYMPS